MIEDEPDFPQVAESESNNSTNLNTDSGVVLKEAQSLQDLVPEPEPEPPEPFALLDAESKREVVPSSHDVIISNDANTDVKTEFGPSSSSALPLKTTPTPPSIPKENVTKDEAEIPVEIPIITKRNQDQPSFNIRYGSDYTHSFTLHSSITPPHLRNILVQHTSLKFAFFHAGVISDKTSFICPDRICLPSLKKITVQIPEDQQSSSKRGKAGLPSEFKRLFHFLKEITFGQLEILRIDCDSVTASVHLPLASAFLPSYEPEDANPLCELVLKNQETLSSLIFGRILKEMTINLCDDETCPGTCDPVNYPKIENFIGFPDLPLMPSLSALLQRQGHLVKLSVTLSHDEVWHDVISAIKLSRNSLKSFAFSLIPIDEEAFTLDLKALQKCSQLRELSLQFSGCAVIGWGFVPGTITTLNFLGGTLTNSDTESMVLAVPNIEEINVFLSIPKCEERIMQKIANVDPPKNDAVIVDIVHHPVFHFVKAAPKSLKSFNLECDMGVEINWAELRSTLSCQKEFKLIERQEIGDFSLERELCEEQEQDQGEPKEQGGAVLVEGEQVEQVSSEEESFIASCFRVLGLRGR